MLGAPDGAVALQRKYFTVLDQESREEDEILVVRIDDDERGEGEEIGVQYFPQPIDLIAMYMCANGGSMFDERAQCYQATCAATGRKDRSKAGPVGLEGWVGDWMGTWAAGKGPACPACSQNRPHRGRERHVCHVKSSG